MENHTAAPTTTNHGFTNSPAVDTVFGCIYVICSLVGVTGNMAVFSYFWARTDKDLSTCLYLCTSINDATFSSMVIFVAASFFNNRSQTLFGSDTVCLLWGFVYRVIQKMAMFLTGTLSIARTLSLVFPLMTIKRKLVLMVVGAYLGLTLIYDITMTGMSIFKSRYTRSDVYCYLIRNAEHPMYPTLNLIDNILYSAQIALPTLIVMISCLISIIGVRNHSVTNASADRTSQAIKRKATVTIIIITTLHIILSMPMIVNYIFWTITQLKYEWPGPIYSSNVMFYYSWSFSDIMCLALNAMINPIILLARVKSYTQWVAKSTRETIRQGEDKIIGMTELVDEELSIINRRMDRVIIETEYRLEEGMQKLSKKVVEHNPLADKSGPNKKSSIACMIETNGMAAFQLNLVPEDTCADDQ